MGRHPGLNAEALRGDERVVHRVHEPARRGRRVNFDGCVTPATQQLLQPRGITQLYAFQRRAIRALNAGTPVVLSGGTVVADGATYDVLTDDDLMAAHRLELPFGFDPATIPGLPGIGNLPA